MVKENLRENKPTTLHDQLIFLHAAHLEIMLSIVEIEQSTLLSKCNFEVQVKLTSILQ
jgi:hypothetical protein